MVNICEPLINVVMENKPKALGCSWAVEPLTRVHRLEPKGKGSSMSAPNSLIADVAPPAERRNLTYAGTCTERGKVRHEVVCIAVMPSTEVHHLLFCQQYPIGTCVPGNGGVRSPWSLGPRTKGC